MSRDELMALRRFAELEDKAAGLNSSKPEDPYAEYKTTWGGNPLSGNPIVDTYNDAKGAVEQIPKVLAKSGRIIAEVAGSLVDLAAIPQNIAGDIYGSEAIKIPSMQEKAAQFVDKATGGLSKPNTALERIVDTAGQVMAGGALTGGATSGPSLGSMMASGAAFGGAKEAFPDNPYMQMAAALVPAGYSSARNSIKRLPEGLTAAERYLAKALRKSPTSISERVDSANDYMNNARNSGVSNPSSAEALSSANIFDNTLYNNLDVAKNSPMASQKLGAFREQRANDLPQVTENLANAVDPIVRSQVTGAERFVQGANTTEKNIRKSLNEQAQPLYDATKGSLLPDAHDIFKDPLWRSTLSEVRGNPALNRRIQDMPDNSIGVVNEVKKRLDAKSAAAKDAKDYGLKSSIDEFNSELKNVADTAYPKYGQARKIYAEGTPELNQAVEGRLGGLGSSTQSNVGNATKNFMNQPAELVKKDANLLMQHDPEALRAGIASHIRQAQAESIADGTTSIAQKLWKTNDQRERLRGALSYDKKSQEALDRVMKVLSENDRLMASFGNSKTQGRSAIQQTQENAAINGVIGTAIDAKTGGFTKLIGSTRKLWDQTRREGFADDLTDLLLTPRGLELAKKLRYYKPSSKTAQDLVAEYLVPQAVIAPQINRAQKNVENKKQ